MVGDYMEEKGVWRTVGGRRIFIAEGQSLSDAMKNSSKKSSKIDNNKIKQLEKDVEDAKGLFARAEARDKLEAYKEGYDNVEDYHKSKKEKKEKLIEEEKKKQEEIRIKKEKEIESKKKQLEEDIKNSSKEQNEQYEIIKENNPMLDDYHVGIRSPKDIKTFSEVLDDEESFSWGDFSKKDAEKALETGTVTIYSSKPIEQGVFVSTSKIQSEQYAGGGKLYSKNISIKDVAWINGDEGQFAKIK
jgi:hypothetical protein